MLCCVVSCCCLWRCFGSSNPTKQVDIGTAFSWLFIRPRFENKEHQDSQSRHIKMLSDLRTVSHYPYPKTHQTYPNELIRYRRTRLDHQASVETEAMVSISSWFLSISALRNICGIDTLAARLCLTNSGLIPLRSLILFASSENPPHLPSPFGCPQSSFLFISYCTNRFQFILFISYHSSTN